MASGVLSWSTMPWDYTPGPVITRDVSFEGFTATDWQRLADVFRAPGRLGRAQQRSGAARRGGGGHDRQPAPQVGAHQARPAWTCKSAEWPQKLPTLAGRYDASWAVELSAGALEDLVERFSERLRPRQDYLEQALELGRALRELEAEGSDRDVAASAFPTSRCPGRA